MEAYSFKTFKNLNRRLTFLGLPPAYIVGAITGVVLVYMFVHVLAGAGALLLICLAVRNLYQATKAGDSDHATTIQLPTHQYAEDSIHLLSLLKRERSGSDPAANAKQAGTRNFQ
jgi:uncharacterized membrane protein YfcA